MLLLFLSHLQEHFPNGLLSSGFATTSDYAFIICVRATCPTNIILDIITVMKRVQVSITVGRRRQVGSVCVCVCVCMCACVYVCV